MRTPQLRHLPRSISHEITGMLSQGRTGASQDGQCEPGADERLGRGTRWATTFRKLPISAPSNPVVRVSDMGEGSM